MQYLNWYGEHPWLGTFLVIMIPVTIIGIFEAIFRRKECCSASVEE